MGALPITVTRTGLYDSSSFLQFSCNRAAAEAWPGGGETRRFAITLAAARVTGNFGSVSGAPGLRRSPLPAFSHIGKGKAVTHVLAGESCFSQVDTDGQGRGRTADLPFQAGLMPTRLRL